MKAVELLRAITEKVTFTSLYQPKEREHIETLIALGRVFPTTRAQAIRVAKAGGVSNTSFSVLYNTDVEQLIEPLLNKHGYEGKYRLTKSGKSCRLVNLSDFCSALKKEFCF